MKSLFRNILKQQLGFFARCVVKKYKPVIVGITGSVGKSSTKEAVFTVLSKGSRARKSEKNLNNEFGIPLTIIGADDPQGRLFGWVGVILRAFWICLLRDRNFPEVLVLEMGADRIGDIEHLTRLAPPSISVITSIGGSHLEYFSSRENIVKEKTDIIRTLSNGGVAVLNRDDDTAWSQRNVTSAKTLSYGFHEDALVQARDVSFDYSAESPGVRFKLYHQDSTVPVLIPRGLGKPIVRSALAAAAVGIASGMNLVDIAEALGSHRPLAGRLVLLSGIKGTWILDDTYNSSPDSAIAALDALSLFETNSDRWAVLGDMLELGSETESGHRKVGEYVEQKGIDYLITVGERSIDTLRAAREAGMDEDHSFSFDTSGEAGRFLQDRIESGDVVLIKGSQGMRMELAVKEIMGEPQRARELLCRQDATWV